MNLSDDSDLIIEGSRNLSDDAPEQTDPPLKSMAYFVGIMKEQGISVEREHNAGVVAAKYDGDFSKELLDQGGVEIVPCESEEEYSL